MASALWLYRSTPEQPTLSTQGVLAVWLDDKTHDERAHVMRRDWAKHLQAVYAKDTSWDKYNAWALYQRLIQVPKVGMGITQGFINDRYPYQVSAVKSPNQIWVVRLQTVWVEGVKLFKPYEDGVEPELLTRRQDGRWYRKDTKLGETPYWSSLGKTPSYYQAPEI